MRPSAALAVATAAATAATVAAPAHADTRALLAADTFVSTAPGSLDANAVDVAWSAHLEWRDGTRRAAVVDYVERESLIGSDPRRELHDLAYTDHTLGAWSVTVGRYRVPGGYWLIADGAAIGRRSGNLEVSVFGGNRSFTNARVETLLTAHPRPLPLVGASLVTRGDVAAAVAYVYTADRVTLYRGDAGAGDVTAETRTPEQFVDAELVAAIGAHGFLTGGATAGSRYLVTYPSDAARLTADPTLQNVWFGSQAAYAMLDERVGAWRLAGTLTAERTQLGQVADPGALAAITGSFVEASARATWRVPKTWRVDARYRARVWADGGQAHRAQVAAEWRQGDLDVQASAGLDVHHDLARSPGYTSSRSLLYRASIGRKTMTNELAGGVAAVSALGDETAATVPADNAPDTNGERAPFTLEARSYAFVHAFGTRGAWFGGVDGEADLHGDGVRVLAQIGWAR